MSVLHIRDKNGNLIPINSIKGDPGKSAYQIWIEEGHTGTEADFLEWLKGTLTLEDGSVTFAEAATRSNLASGDKLSAIFGKVKKWFADLKALAFKDKADWNTDIDNRPAIPSKVSDLTNDSNFQTNTQVQNAIAALVDSSPSALDTLNELAAALGDDPNFSATMLNALAGKVSIIEGKGLSTNDYTTNEKNKLAGIGIVHSSATIDPGDWTLTDGLYRATINDSFVIDGCVINASPANESYDAAAAAELLPFISASVGSFTVRAKNQPTESIIIYYSIQS